MPERACPKGGSKDLVHGAVSATGDDAIHAALLRLHNSFVREPPRIAIFPCDANLDVMTIGPDRANCLSYPRVLR
ncbi:hypothetical protein Sbs19_00100 [Sphingobium sp. BS19]|nr:hypothetical protein Sbs19_00100 [Sphingobium sp. BS19]